MTGPGAGSASRMRIAGIVLLAVAAVAAVVGLIALGSQGPSSPSTAASASSPPAAPPPASTPASPTTPPPPSSAPGSAGLPGSTGAPGTAAPPAGGAPGTAGGPVVAAPIVPPAEGAGSGSGSGSGGGSGGGSGSGPNTTSTSAVPVRVLNNSLITGLAERAATDLRGRGWNVVEVGNYPAGIIPVSTAYFRPGTDEEAAAQTIAAQTGIRAEPRFDGIQNASPGVIVIATNNWGTTAPKS